MTTEDSLALPWEAILEIMGCVKLIADGLQDNKNAILEQERLAKYGLPDQVIADLFESFRNYYPTDLPVSNGVGDDQWRIASAFPLYRLL